MTIGIFLRFKVVGEGEPLRLTSDPAEELFPAWSPDGRWIAYMWRSLL